MEDKLISGPQRHKSSTRNVVEAETEGGGRQAASFRLLFGASLSFLLFIFDNFDSFRFLVGLIYYFNLESYFIL